MSSWLSSVILAQTLLKGITVLVVIVQLLMVVMIESTTGLLMDNRLKCSILGFLLYDLALPLGERRSAAVGCCWLLQALSSRGVEEEPAAAFFLIQLRGSWIFGSPPPQCFWAAGLLGFCLSPSRTF